MDKKFLNKVVDQIVSETEIDIGYEGNTLDDYRIYGPFVSTFYKWIPYHYMVDPTFEDIVSFEDHCKNVYGLTEEESEYVWDEWRSIIKDKIKNG
jgi:hypothetical protein